MTFRLTTARSSEETTANVFSRRVSQPRRFVLKLETPGPHDPLPLASAALLPLWVSQLLGLGKTRKSDKIGWMMDG